MTLFVSIVNVYSVCLIVHRRAWLHLWPHHGFNQAKSIKLRSIKDTGSN